MWRFFFFLLGFGLMVVGSTYIITYLNLLTMGYSIGDYLGFIFSRVECIFVLIGLGIVSFVIITSRRQEHDLYL